MIGLIEGAADLVANVLKYLTGLVADRRARMKPLIMIGYGVSTVIRPLVAFAVAPWHVLVVRVGDRVGKGVRTSPRDALIANATEPSIRGRAYGFHRAMDHAGAAIGTLLGAGLLWYLGAATAESATADQMRIVRCTTRCTSGSRPCVRRPRSSRCAGPASTSTARWPCSTARRRAVRADPRG